jgi:hypothetical protein
MTGKTSTFTIHHDRCKPATWTPGDVLQLAKFVETGDIRYAAHLSRMGVQLVLSEHHAPKGGVLMEMGWADPQEPHTVYDDLTDAVSSTGDEDVTELCRVYIGHPEYVATFQIDDGHGDYGGTEHEIKPTREEAEAFMASMREDA